MAHISKYRLKDGTYRYRGHVHRVGHKPLTQGGFRYRKDAARWGAEQERKIQLSGLPLTIDDLKKHTVGDIVRRYRREITPTKASRTNEDASLNAFLRHDLCRKSLAYVKTQDAYAYRDERLKSIWRGKPIRPSTVRREFNILNNVFKVAREQWGFENLNNPFSGITIKGSVIRRKRRLKDGEDKRLQAAFDKCLGLNKLYVPAAVFLAIETGMRLQEIFNLTWADIDLAKRRIDIRKSKTDHLTEFSGRTIVLAIKPHFFLSLLRYRTILANEFQYSKHQPIFPMTEGAFKQSWADARKRAAIKGLTFHDLRHEAGSRFDEAGLTKAEHDLMMGHSTGDMASLYIHSDLKSIQDKLDRYHFEKQGAGRLTLAEVLANADELIAQAPEPVSPELIAIMDLINSASESECR